jgi:Tyrosyl-DNA phosphodiesterase
MFGMKRTLEEHLAQQEPANGIGEEFLLVGSRVRVNRDEAVPSVTNISHRTVNTVPRGVDEVTDVANMPKPAAERIRLSGSSLPFVPDNAGCLPPAPATKSRVSMKKDMYINMLSHYDTNTSLDCMVRFREIFFPRMHTGGFDEPKSIKNVMMTCFGFETDLLMSVIQNSKKLLIYNDSADAQFRVHECFQGRENVTVILPSKPSLGWGNGAFHPKLWLVEFEGGTLRVVLGSGNLAIADWAVWSNCIWYQDFEKKVVRIGSSDDSPLEIDPKLGGKSADFFGYLNNFIDKITPSGLHHTRKYSDIHLDRYDFNVPIFPVLVASVPGKHQINPCESISYGLDRLREISSVYRRSKTLVHLEARITYQSSSVGSVTAAFLVRFLSKFSLNKKVVYFQIKNVS